MGDDDASFLGIPDDGSDLFLYAFHPADAIVEDDDLSATSKLMFDSMSNRRFVPFGNDGTDWFLLPRWGREE